MSEIRSDGYVNTVIGHGLQGRDPMRNTKYYASPILTDGILAELYNNALARRIVDLPADEAVKNGIIIPEDKEEKRAIQMLDDLGWEEHFSDALRWSRLFGGAGILMMIDDGGNLDEPVREGAIEGIESLIVYDKREIITNSWLCNQNPRSLRYGKPEFYQINSADGGVFYAHFSRLLIFDGDPLPRRERIQRNWWGLPVMQGLQDGIMRFDHGHALAILIQERMSQSVMKIKELFEKLATEDGEAQVKQYLQIIDMARSLLNTVAMDTEDEYAVFNLPLTGIKDLLDAAGQYVAALAGMPFSVLFGRAPTGLQATGQSDLEQFYNLVGRLQKRRMKPNIDRLVKLLQLCRKGLFAGVEMDKWTIEMCPLWLPSAKEIAETRKQNADADKAEADAAKTYNEMGALDASEMRKKLAEEKKYPIDESLDMFPDDGAEGAI